MEPYVHDCVLDMTIARDQLLAAIDAVGTTDWGRYVPYGGRTLHELLAHLAGADQAWAVAAQGLLRSEGGASPAPADPEAARQRAIDRGRTQPPEALLEEMERRRRLLLGLYELLEPKHLAQRLPAYGERHNSVRERIWRGYHDRRHTDDISRALRMSWQPPRLGFLPELTTAVDALQPEESLYIIYSVDPVAWELPSGVGEWTNRQLLAHIATGDWVLQTHLRSVIDTGKLAEWPDVNTGNAERVGERQWSNMRTLVDEYLSTRHETFLLMSQLHKKHLALTLEYWWTPRPNTHTLLEYLHDFEVHDASHREQLRPAMRHARATGGRPR